MGKSDWFWENETKINASDFSTNSDSGCQQMSWPLTYSDGINLNAKNCQEESYALCQYKCKIILNI